MNKRTNTNISTSMKGKVVTGVLKAIHDGTPANSPHLCPPPLAVILQTKSGRNVNCNSKPQIITGKDCQTTSGCESQLRAFHTSLLEALSS